MRPHYLQFDATYQRLKATGTSWNSPADVAEATELFQEFLTAPEVRCEQAIWIQMSAAGRQ